LVEIDFDRARKGKVMEMMMKVMLEVEVEVMGMVIWWYIILRCMVKSVFKKYIKRENVILGSNVSEKLCSLVLIIFVPFS